MVVLVACTGSEPSASGPSTTSSVPVVDVPEPVRYRVVYELSDPTSDETTTIDELTVHRPDRSQLLLRDGDGAVVGDQRVAVDRIRLAPLEPEVVIARAPGPPLSDVRVRPVLDAALGAGLLVDIGSDVVADRPCRRYRSGTLLGAGVLRPPSLGEWAESCIDGAGLLLEEVLYLDGEATFTRRAVSVSLGSAEDGGTPDTDDRPAGQADVGRAVPLGEAIPTPAVDGAVEEVGSVRPVDPAAGALGTFWVLEEDDVPTGFSFDRRLGVIPSQAEAFADAAGNSRVIAATADIYRSDDALVVVLQGSTLGGGPAFGPVPWASPVTVGALGSGELVLSALGSEVRVDRGAGDFVHVRGSVPPAILVEVATALVPTEGTGLVYLDG